MKIAVVGDPHGDLKKIRKIPLKNIDLILCTGDLGKANLARERYFENLTRKGQGLDELEEDARFIQAEHEEIHNSTIEVMQYLAQHAPTYTIQGNVGIPKKAQVQKLNEKWGLKLQSTYEALKKMKNVHLTKNRLRVIDDIRIGFLEYFVDTSWVREFKPSNYKERMKKAKKETDKARRVLKRFGNNLDILLFHQPPYRSLDKVGAPAPMQWRGKHAGSKAVLDYIKKAQPQYGFCGHIHEGEGHTKIGKTEVYNLGVGGYKTITI